MTDSTKSISPLRQRMIDDMKLRKLAPKTQAAYLRAVIKFTCFFGVTLERLSALKRMSRVRKPQKLPRVLSVDEVARLLAGASNPKHRAALAVAYGAGLRASEVVHLKIADIDSERMIVRVGVAGATTRLSGGDGLLRGRGHLPRPGSCVAPGPCRTHQSWPVKGHVSDRALPQCCARRSRAEL